MKVKSEGLDEVLRNLDKFEGRAMQLSTKAVRNVGKSVAKKLEANTPMDSDNDNPSHLKDNVVVRMKKTKDEGYKLAYVTYSGNGKGQNNPKDVKWRAGFVEWGTIHQRPQGFVYKTVKQVQKDVERMLISELRGLL